MELIALSPSANLARPLQQRHGALPVIWRAQLVGAVLTAPLGLPALTAAHWSLKPLLSLLALGTLGTGAAFVLIGKAAARVGATRASSATFLIPPVAIVLGVVLRGEHVALLSIAGSAICVAGAWLIRPVPTKHALPKEASGYQPSGQQPCADQA